VADLNEGRAERMRQFEIFVAELAVRSAFFRSFTLHVHVGCRPRQRVTSPYLSVDVAFPYKDLASYKMTTWVKYPFYPYPTINPYYTYISYPDRQSRAVSSHAQPNSLLSSCYLF
jgi:hypothetical protein